VSPWSPLAFAVAVGCAAVAALIRFGLGGTVSGLAPFTTFFPAILVTSLACGAPAGLFAVLLGGLGGWSFIPAAELGWTAAVADMLLYAFTGTLIVGCAAALERGYRRLQKESDEGKRRLAFITDGNGILSAIMAGAPLEQTFERLLASMEGLSDSTMLASILLLDQDGTHLRHVAAPSLPSAYKRAVDGLAVGPTAGSCGTAIYRREPVIVVDIATDPLWQDWRSLALKHGLRACWSLPLTVADGSVLGTIAIYHREAHDPSAAELDLAAFISRIAALALDRSQRGARRQLLLEEMRHRVRNTLAIVQALARQTLQSKVEPQVWDDYHRRLMKLSNAHDLIVREEWTGAHLAEVVSRSVLEPSLIDANQITLEGPDVRIEPRLALVISMALHELCTNAAKYGALSTPSGKVSIRWHVSDSTDGTRLLRFRWTEEGGPSVEPPKLRGFGSRLIEYGLASELRGKSVLEFRPEGVVWHCEGQLPRRSARLSSSRAA
jgi:two-component sensor histidine kinase